MTSGEPDIAWLRLTNQLLAVAIFAMVIVIGVVHSRRRKFSIGAGLVAALMILFSLRLVLAVFGELAFSILGEPYRIISNSVSFSIFLILLAYIIYESTESGTPYS